MLPEKELTSSQRLSLSAALVWPAIDLSEGQRGRPAGAFKGPTLAVGRSAAGASVEEPERDLLRRMASALRLGPGGRQGSLSASQPEENDVIETPRRRPAGPTPPGARPTAQRPQRRRQGG